MNGLVREMLDYTRLDRTDELKNRKTLNLTALVCDVLTEYAPLFEKRRHDRRYCGRCAYPWRRNAAPRAVGACSRTPPSIRRKTGVCPFG